MAPCLPSAATSSSSMPMRRSFSDPYGSRLTSSSSSSFGGGGMSDVLTFCARSILYGISAGVSFYALSQWDATSTEFSWADDLLGLGGGNTMDRRRRRHRQQPTHPTRRGDEPIEGTTRTKPSSVNLKSILATALRSTARHPEGRERVWRAIRDRLPILTWMSLFACLMDESKALGPRRVMAVSLALQWLLPSPPLEEDENDGPDRRVNKRSIPTKLWVPDDEPSDAMRRQAPHDDVMSRPSSGSASPARQEHQRTTKAQRYVELLVHNVSHTDMILSLERDCDDDEASDGFEVEPAPSMDQSFVQVPVSPLRSPSSQHVRSASSGTPRSTNHCDDPFCLVRPRFSCFEKYSRMVWDHLEAARSGDVKGAGADDDHDDVLYFERYSRNEESHALFPDASLEETATGLRLSNARQMPPVDLHEVRVRGRDVDKARGVCRVRHVFFPLLATLLPRWKERIHEKQYRSSSAVKRVLILVSGVGTPRNWTHDRMGNSTATCARVMKAFLERIDPNLTVVHIHSETNIFRYDENLVFSEKELMPIVHSYRDAHARGLPYPDERDAPQGSEDEVDISLRTHPFSADWRESFSTTLSFADGSPARTYAIQASLRQYRPTYFHLWQLKTFWHESKIVNDDIEVHSFEAMETIPPVDIRSCTDPMVAMVIDEMKRFKEDMIRTLASDNDIRRFWLRKTHKPVLAVLLVHSDGSDEEPVLYRGTNMEVSMPTGSLCAERNVIGTALADRPGLKREDLKLIAVLAVPMEDAGIRVPATSDVAGLRRVHSCNADINLTPTSLSARRTSFGSEEDREWILPFPRPGSHPLDATENDDGSFTPRRTVSLVSKSPRNAAAAKRIVVLQGTHRDLNPLRPCGACNEWLKKISECNPYFKILTFTDAECNGVYITPCQD